MTFTYRITNAIFLLQLIEYNNINYELLGY